MFLGFILGVGRCAQAVERERRVVAAHRDELVVAAPTGSHDHAAHASLDQSEQERRRDQLDRQKQTNISTKLTDQSGRQPSANDVAKTQEIAQSTNAGGASLGTNAAELGGSVEDLAAVLAL